MPAAHRSVRRRAGRCRSPRRAPPGGACACWSPGADVLLAEPDVPVKAGARLQQLVPYALEEQLAENIDELHFALGKRSADSHAYAGGGGGARTAR